MKQSRRDVLRTLATPEAWRKLTRGLLGSCGSLASPVGRKPVSADEAGKALGTETSTRLSQLLAATPQETTEGD